MRQLFEKGVLVALVVVSRSASVFWSCWLNRSAPIRLRSNRVAERQVGLNE